MSYFKKDKFNIKVRYPFDYKPIEEIEVNGWLHGSLAINSIEHGYDITHVASGRAMYRAEGSLRAAVKFIKEIEKRFDLALDYETLNKLIKSQMDKYREAANIADDLK